MRREIASWRADGWAPASAFTQDVLRAYEAAQAGAPPAIVEEVLAPFVEGYGADAVAEAFRIVRAEMGAWERQAAEERRG